MIKLPIYLRHLYSGDYLRIDSEAKGFLFNYNDQSEEENPEVSREIYSLMKANETEGWGTIIMQQHWGIIDSDYFNDQYDLVKRFRAQNNES